MSILLCFSYTLGTFCVILTCPPTNDESPKLLEFVSYKPYSKFGVHMSSFYVIFGG
jgi:hypothetical protein